MTRPLAGRARLSRASVAALFVAVGAAACSSSSAKPPPPGVRSVTIAGHAAVEDGHGTTAIVLAHGASTHKEQWLPYLPKLAAAGFDAVALDLGNDRPGAVRAAVAYVRRNGATNVVLMGSSAGCADVLEVAAQGSYAAVVTMSAVAVHTTDENVLAIASEHDGVAPDSPAVARQIVAGSGARSTVDIVTGGKHGADIVQLHPDIVDTVISWLRSRLAS